MLHLCWRFETCLPHTMNRTLPVLAAASLLALAPLANLRADDALPKTLLATRGKLLVSEDFSPPLAPVVGKPVGFASGFTGWRYTSDPAGGHSGRWELANGEFKGIESLTAHHPATASLGLQFQDAIIQCEVRLNDVPDEGRKSRYLQIKATDTKDYICALSLGQGGMSGRSFDDTQINPATKQRMEGTAARLSKTVKLGEWHTLVMEIQGDEVVGTLDNQSFTFSYPLIGVAKHSLMLVAGTEASFRKLRVWEALPNPDWPKSKAALGSASEPVEK